jgi:hypothetical protein
MLPVSFSGRFLFNLCQVPATVRSRASQPLLEWHGLVRPQVVQEGKICVERIIGHQKLLYQCLALPAKPEVADQVEGAVERLHGEADRQL